MPTQQAGAMTVTTGTYYLTAVVGYPTDLTALTLKETLVITNAAAGVLTAELSVDETAGGVQTTYEINSLITTVAATGAVTSITDSCRTGGTAISFDYYSFNGTDLVLCDTDAKVCVTFTKQ
jgi:hypothetical protein